MQQFSVYGDLCLFILCGAVMTKFGTFVHVTSTLILFSHYFAGRPYDRQALSCCQDDIPSGRVMQWSAMYSMSM